MSAVPDGPLAQFRAAFEALGAADRAGGPERGAAFERFAALGFPPERDEAWKYTSLRRLASRRFTSPTDDAPVPALDEPLAPHRIVVVDGRLDPRSAMPAALPAGVTLRTLAGTGRDGEPMSALLRVPQGGGTERFAALNSALCPDVLMLEIAAHASPPPLEIVLAAAGRGAGMSHPRLLVRAAARSISRLVVRHVGEESAERLVNAVIDVEVGGDAKVHLYRWLASGDRGFHIERIEATVGQRGTFVLHDAQLGAGLGRLDVIARLAAPGAGTELTGLFLADGSRHLDTHLHVDHLAPDTHSLQDYRGIASGSGRAVFNGKAVVHPGAQKSRARQTSRNLLLTLGAEIDTKPELEIYADDVQCSHGATTGQLDPLALFYLRSRGLDELEARSALTRAFCGSVLSRMDHAPFAAAVRGALDERLGQLVEERP